MTDDQIEAVLRDVFAPAAEHINGKRLKGSTAVAEMARYCEKAAEQAPDRESAAAAYLNTLPLLTDRHNAIAYIACVARGVALGLFTALEASKLVYIAQTALTAARKERY